MLDQRLPIYGQRQLLKSYSIGIEISESRFLLCFVDTRTWLPLKKPIGNMATLLPMIYSSGPAPLTPSKHLPLRFSFHLSSKKTRRWLDAYAIKLPRYHSLQPQPRSKSITGSISATMATGYVSCPYMYILAWIGLVFRVSVWLLTEKIKGKEKDDEKLAPPISTPWNTCFVWSPRTMEPC